MPVKTYATITAFSTDLESNTVSVSHVIGIVASIPATAYMLGVYNPNGDAIQTVIVVTLSG